ncbi:retrovirus-related pol polyprotein from transposon TNT 1-94 [Tanacetum coccineum]
MIQPEPEDLPSDIPLDSVVVLRYEKRSKSENKAIMPTEMELTIERTQQSVSYEVSVSIEGVEERKINVRIKGEKKEALHTLRQKSSQYINCDKSWIVVMQEELNQFIANNVWELVPQPKNMTIIGTKWVYRNKLDENGVVSRNKARLVAQGYNQQKGIDYDKTYSPVARLESIRILLAYACALDFKLFQMDVKSAFLNGFINEEVYVAQPPGLIDFEKSDHVYKLKKALYGLKQAPKAWYSQWWQQLDVDESNS